MGYNLRRAHGVQKQRFATVFGPLSIRPVTLSALGIIYENPGITQADLGKKLNIKRANMVPVMAELEGRGLIARRPSDNDRRVHVVALTPAGLKLTVKLLDMHRRLEDDLARELGLRERDQLLQLLKRFRKLATEPELDDGED
jgi:DNA-binding MarR family transcriptional regulator